MDEPTRRAALHRALELAQHLLELAPQAPHSVGTIERADQRFGAHLHFTSPEDLQAFAEKMGAAVSETPVDTTGDVDLEVTGGLDGTAYYATARRYAEVVTSPAAALGEQLLQLPEVVQAVAPFADVLHVKLHVRAEEWPQWLERYAAAVIGRCGAAGRDLAAVGTWAGVTVQLVGVGLGQFDEEGKVTSGSVPGGITLHVQAGAAEVVTGHDVG